MSRNVVSAPPVTKTVEEMQDLLAHLTDRVSGGVQCMKLSRREKRQPVTLLFDQDLSFLFYQPTTKSISEVSFLFSHVVNVTSQSSGSEYFLTVECGNGRVMRLVFDSHDTFESVEQPIAYAVRRASACHGDDPARNKLFDLWLQADKNRDKVLRYEELSSLANAINIGLSEAALTKLFKRFDANGDGTLSFKEFVGFYELVTEIPELRPMYQTYAASDGLLHEPEVTKLFQELNGETLMPELSQQFIVQYGLNGNLHFRGFCDFLLDLANNSWFIPRRSAVFQDMTQELHHYFIATSHNTFLTGDQLQSKGSVDMYRTALLNGCRCVELDCWDGPANEPIVYHGYTRTSKIRFREVIAAVNEYAFRSTPFPVILALEVHASQAQSRVMASLLQSILGDKLFTFKQAFGDHFSRWSPEALKKKVLVKWKLAENDDDDAKETEDCPEIATAKKLLGEVSHKGPFTELRDCVVLGTIKSLDWGATASPYNFQSFSEPKALELSNSNRDKFVALNAKMLSRVYPAARRTDSTNYDPTTFWAAGVQCVALNHQTWDEWMRMHEGRFLENGRCGYVLKPLHLRNPGSGTPKTMTFRITVILGSQLPKPRNERKGEIIDPYVVVILRGPGLEGAQKKTKCIEDNGFSPFWNESLEFIVKDVEMTLLTLRVLDKDLVGADGEIAEATISLSSLRLGVRSVPLISTFDGQQLKDGRLLCRFELFL